MNASNLVTTVNIRNGILSENGRTRGNSAYRAEIDGLRALAVVAVILNHIDEHLLPSGYLGVDVFFVISGFVITSSLAEAAKRSSSPRDFLLGFYERRIKRLLPARVLFSVVTSVLVCLFNPDPKLSLRTGMASLFGLSNLYLYRQATDYFAPSSNLNVFTHTWSLGVEEQFYFLFPMLFWFSTREPDVGMRRLRIALTALSCVSLVLFVLLYPGHQSVAYFSMPTRFWELGAGCLVAVGVTRSRPQPASSVSAEEGVLARSLQNCILPGLVAVLLLPPRYAVPATIGVVVLTASLVVTVRPGTRAFRLLTRPTIVSIGLMSYSLYLWHWGVLSLSRWTIGIHWWSAPIQLGLMGLLAWISYTYFERPLRHARWSSDRWRSIAVGLGASTVTAAVVLLLASTLHGRLYSGHGDAATVAPIDYVGAFTKRVARRCHSSDTPQNDALRGETVITSAFERNCFYDAGPQKRLFAFIGDSHALSLFPMGESLAANEDVSVFAHSRDGCVFPSQGRTTRRGCDEVMQSTESFLISKFRRSGGGVLVAASYLLSHFGYGGDHSRQFAKHSSGTASDVDNNLRDYVLALSRLAESLLRVKSVLVVVAPLPRHPGLDPKLCVLEWFRPRWALPERCSYSNQESDAAQRRRILEALKQLSAHSANILIYDAFDVLCPSSQRCLVTSNGKMYYEDDNHLSTDGALGLYDDFSRFLRKNGLLKQRL